MAELHAVAPERCICNTWEGIQVLLLLGAVVQCSSLVGHAGSQSLGRQWWSSSVISQHAWWLTQQCSVIGSLVVASL